MAFSVHLYDFFSISFADGTIHLMKSPQMCLEQCFLCRASGAEPLFMAKLSFYQDKSFSYQLFFSSKFCSLHTTFSSHHLQVLRGGSGGNGPGTQLSNTQFLGNGILSFLVKSFFLVLSIFAKVKIIAHFFSKCYNLKTGNDISMKPTANSHKFSKLSMT